MPNLLVEVCAVGAGPHRGGCARDCLCEGFPLRAARECHSLPAAGLARQLPSAPARQLPSETEGSPRVAAGRPHPACGVTSRTASKPHTARTHRAPRSPSSPVLSSLEAQRIRFFFWFVIKRRACSFVCFNTAQATHRSQRQMKGYAAEPVPPVRMCSCARRLFCFARERADS